MNPTRLRRLAAIISIVLFAIFVWLWNNSQPATVQVKKPPVLYKVRAFTQSRADAENLVPLGEAREVKSYTTETNRTIRKFMGFRVIQQFKVDEDSPHGGYIRDFLVSRGFEVTIVNRDRDSLTLQVGGACPRQELAEDLAQKVYENTGVSFEVEKYFKETPYRAFTVIFDEIDSRQTAEELRSLAEEVTSEVELVSY